MLSFSFAMFALEVITLSSDLMKIIGDRLRNIRKEKGLSQEAVADLSGLHFTYVGKLERAEKSATIDSLEKLTTALGVSLAELFRFIEPSTEEKDNFILMQLINKLQGRTIDEQKKILKMIELWLE